MHRDDWHISNSLQIRYYVTLQLPVIIKWRFTAHVMQESYLVERLRTSSEHGGHCGTLQQLSTGIQTRLSSQIQGVRWVKFKWEEVKCRQV
jgi:hypothetical protein